MSKIIELAHQLAQAITSSEEYQQLRKAEEDMMNDDAAQVVIKDYNDFQQRMHDENDKDELVDRVEYIEREMKNTPSIATYLDAQDKVTKILEEVNFILGKAINGDYEENSCNDSDCGGGCCGCS